VRPGSLWRCDLAVDIPQVLPGLIFLPKKDLAFDEPAVSIDLFDFMHFFAAERFAYDSPEIGQNVSWT
jgi:hypothetical protein